MKIKSYLSIAGAALMLAACQGASEKGGKSLADIPNATAADSLIYYFGQMRGAEYQREAERDTTLDTDQAKKAYVQGVQAGLNAAKANDEAYNRGLFLGMQMAMNMQQFKDEYDVQLNKKVFVESLSDAISADSVQDAREMQKEFYRIMGSFNEQKEKRDKEAADAALTQEAAKLKLAKISEVLYGEVTAKNDSAKIKTGDNVVMEIKLSNAGGKEIEAPLPSRGKVGARNIMAPLNDALTALKTGETGKFVTSAQALFGQRCQQLGMKPADAVVFTMKASVTPSDEVKDNPRKVTELKVK